MLAALTKSIKSSLSSAASVISIVAATSILLAACGGGVDAPNRWVATWYAAPQNYNDPLSIVPVSTPFTVENQTIRQIVHLSKGGNAVRLKLANLFGSGPVSFSAIRIARNQGSGGAIDVATDKPVTFSGSTALTLEPGAVAWSDSINIPVSTHDEIAISIYLAGGVQVADVHSDARQTNYFAPGNQTSNGVLKNAISKTSYYWVSELDVNSSNDTKVVVAFGDSITDGHNSTVDANHRWPNFLDDLAQSPGSRLSNLAVVNSGISGNRWLTDGTGPNGLSRFDRDVLGISGVTHVIILLGINDIGFPYLLPSQAVTANQIIQAMQTAISKAKERGLKVYLGTLTPMGGSPYFNTNSEADRQSVNAFIRLAPKGVDGVIDFDKAIQDPADSTRMLAAYDSGDHLHPNDAGYKAMADAINLASLN
ncbi:GDSL family lipase [Caballeronia fortuita]|uniref:GDSL family lipase n=1 Tax=Caballeronia fortuita TaxID=1777138 RepID=A0A158A7N6_9BURK|nr:SGNH/GDSL hydrolase family protein [Caballeronia fortuita]SAK53646.1 GDSL family lipase [Caballeronia fortuita]